MQEKEKTKNRNSIKYIEKSKKGITLVALVVTIVVLLILAGVTITALLGDDGIIKKAQNAADSTNSAVQNELSGMNNLTDKMNSVLNGIGGGGENIDPETGWNLDKVTKVESEDKIIVPVPIGYTASSATGENSVNNGFVIYEGTEAVNDSNVDTAKTSRNQFVWVPVNEITEIANQTSGTDDNGRQNYQGKLYKFSTSGATEMSSYGQGTTSCREPDIVTGNSSGTGTDYDGSSTKLSILGLSSSSDFKTQLQEEFNEMIESVETYGGFYIGRYETGNLSQAKAVVQKNNTDIGSKNWYNMYMKCKTVAEGTEGTSSMIWGCQWDATMKWFLTSSDKSVRTYVTDSTGKGNYEGTNGDEPIATGSNDDYRVNNIYDMAGNVHDWTLEASDTRSRVIRRWLLQLFWFQLSGFLPLRPPSGPQPFQLSVAAPHFI